MLSTCDDPTNDHQTIQMTFTLRACCSVRQFISQLVTAPRCKCVFGPLSQRMFTNNSVNSVLLGSCKRCSVSYYLQLSVWCHLECFEEKQLAKDDVPSRNTQLRARAVCKGFALASQTETHTTQTQTMQTRR